ncbi:MAG: helix-turn-helix domain-containing protein [Bacteroidetes bacterium]|nr:helix-turn-helix domain-containing protein [Bacteroidota bacterium]
MKAEKEILARLTALEEKLTQNSNSPLNFKEACEYLGFAPSYLYKLTCKNIIPHYKPSGKRLYFFKKELDEWIAKGSNQ